MTGQTLERTATALVGAGKGLLAMDESTPTCNRRFREAGIPETAEARRAYRELLVTTPRLGDCISGAILYDETIREQDRHGTLMVARLLEAGIIPGIKVDLGTTELALHRDEKITEGLDGLRERLREYAGLGARFAKWRAVIGIGGGHPGGTFPSPACIDANAHALARYAALCQEAGLVPIVEPEVLMEGDHSIARCGQVTETVLQSVFAALQTQQVALEGLILKPNMVLSGLACPEQASVEQAAEATLDCLLRNVPASVAGIAFLSGGQPALLTSARLNAINVRAHASGGRAPWPVVFSFARAIQQPALALWHGSDANVIPAQQALHHRAECNRAALRGEYHPSMESTGSTGW